MLEFKHKKMQKLKKVNMHNHLPNIQQGIQAWCSYQIYDPKSDYPRNYNVKKTKQKKKGSQNNNYALRIKNKNDTFTSYIKRINVASNNQSFLIA